MALKFNNKAQYSGYVPYTVDAAIKKMVHKLDFTPANLVELVQGLTDDGCKVSVTWEDERQCYFVQAFQQTKGHVNAGLILSARHSDLMKAAALLQVLVTEVMPDAWVNPESDVSQYLW